MCNQSIIHTLKDYIQYWEDQSKKYVRKKDESLRIKCLTLMEIMTRLDYLKGFHQGDFSYHFNEDLPITEITLNADKTIEVEPTCVLFMPDDKESLEENNEYLVRVAYIPKDNPNTIIVQPLDLTTPLGTLADISLNLGELSGAKHSIAIDRYGDLI